MAKTVVEPQAAETLSDQEHKIVGEYTDILIKSGVVAAGEFLDALPEEPRPVVQGLLRTVRLLHLSADNGRSTPVTEGNRSR